MAADGWTDAELEECPCERTELSERTFSNGTIHWVIQCLSCGRHVKAVRQDGPDKPTRKFDESLPQRYWVARRAHRLRRKQEADRQWRADSPSRQAWYRDEYLNSEHWKRLCALVLKRDNGWCQCCLDRPAVQVHHLSYDHLGEERGWELVSVCRECHKVLECVGDDDELFFGRE